MLDYSLWGLRPAGYLLENVFIHGLNGFLLYLLVQRLSGRWGAAALAALLFTVHPVQVEAVAWVSQRKSVLSLFFFLLSLLLYTTYCHGEAAATRRRSYWFSVVAFAAALLSKSTAVVLPLALLLHDGCYGCRPLRRSLADKIPYALAAAGAALLALVSQSAEYGGGGRTSYHGGSPLATFFTMLPVLVRYLRMIVWPSGLSAAYAPAIKTAPDLEVVLAGLLLLLLAGAALLLFRRERQLFFWLALAPLGILPVVQIVPLITLMNDRYLYFPMVGLAPFVVLGCERLLERYWPGLRRAGIGGGALIVLVLGTVASQRVAVWHDATTLWRDAVPKAPHSFMANYVLATIEVKAGRLAQARPLLETLRAMDPDNPKVTEVWGHFYYQSGDMERAAAAYGAAIAKNPRRKIPQLYLGNIYLSQGKVGPAMERFRAAEQLDPLSPDIAYSIACGEALQGHAEASLAALGRAFRFGFRECRAVADNPELDSLRGSGAFAALMADYCGGGRK
jgi:tetratricopeptide (TPR) repeat protein